jgi:hypothetical protein
LTRQAYELDLRQFASADLGARAERPRVSEATGADIEALGIQRGQPLSPAEP